MQPLGLSPGQYRDYTALLTSSHDFEIDVDVLDMEERVVESLRPQFLDGQVNIQREGPVHRTATFSLFDPDRSLHFDSESPFNGGLFGSRMLRYRYGVDLPGVGKVWATAFVGPTWKVSRDGDVLNIDCNDKTMLATEGTIPKTVKKGKNAVDAIEEIMRSRTGERKFRFPQGNRKRLTKTYKVGWKAESSPWRVCQKIANDALNMQLEYSCDGYLVLRRKPENLAADLTGLNALTSQIRSEFDLSEVRNYVRVTGSKKKRVAARAKASKGKKETKVIDVSFTEDASARSHPLAPNNPDFSRNGVPRFLPLLIDDSSIKKERVAQDRADRELARALPMSARASFTAVPLFHLDYSDLIRVDTNTGRLTLPLYEASIPLGLGGDAAYGATKQVSKPRRS